ncbi:MAG: putative nucleotidyltransferase substrate binding domain-containing protein [Pseudomonadota bacterium]
MSLLDQKTFISNIPPFDQLKASALETVINAMDIAYFKKGERLIRAGSSPDALYIIIKGIVQETQDEQLISIYVSQDSFDAMSLLDGNNKNDFIVNEELICYVLPKAFFLKLIENHPPFKAFYYQDISKRLNHLIEQRKTTELSSFMVAKIQDIYLNPPVFVKANTSVYEAVQTMTHQKSSSILVKADHKIGIVTDKDIRDHIVLQRYSIDHPIAHIASYNLITLSPQDLLLHALLVMLRHSIKHLLIKKNDKIIGILEQIDLLSYLSNHTRLIAVQIERAKNKEELKIASHNMTDMIKAFYANGIKIKYMMQLINELNQQIFKKLYTFIAPPALLENSCLIIMGSEGRGEQILKTDQDNGIILRDGFNYQGLEQITEEFTQTLIEFGYPPCQGKIMVNNSAWCRSLKEFKHQIFQWIIEEPLLDLAIFYDAKAIAGDITLLKEAKQYLYKHLQNNQAFFSYFAKPTLSFETPLNLFARFIVDKSHENQLDIKKGGIFPIVHGVRSLALANKITQTNTMKRIKILTEIGIFESAFATDLTEALNFMISLRLQFQLKNIKQGEPYNNYIKPNQLNKLERDLLKDALKIVNDFKKIIIYHFKLDRIT